MRRQTLIPAVTTPIMHTTGCSTHYPSRRQLGGWGNAGVRPDKSIFTGLMIGPGPSTLSRGLMDLS